MSARSIFSWGFFAKMKASRWLSEHATFVDPEGVAIDTELLKADQSQESDA